jgi:hypothetical protein
LGSGGAGQCGEGQYDPHLHETILHERSWKR